MVDDVLTERAREVDAWVAANPGDLADYLRTNPPVHPDDLASAEALIREVDPSGLPARCETCRRRLPMIHRQDRWHPKCAPYVVIDRG